MGRFHLFKKRRHYEEVAPDEIFLDAKNVSNMNTQQFEGVIEQSLHRRTYMMMMIVMVSVLVAFAVQLGFLQIKKGEAYFTQSEQNRLHKITVFSERGLIYDRYDRELAWNVTGQDDEPFSYRAYTNLPGMAHILGFVNYPERDDAGFFWRFNLEGKSGVEALFNDELQGQHGSTLVEVNALQDVQSESVIVEPVDGENIHLTIDAELQSQLYQAMETMVNDFSYSAGAAALMDVKTGALLALTNYPEFDSAIISAGEDSERINQYFNGSDKPSLNRMVSGLYTPGSIVKPFVALGMLEEGVITPRSTVYSDGTLEIPNPWNPDNPSIFRDWRSGGHGTTDVYHAIADSVNTFFYVFGGGYQDIQGLGIDKIDSYLQKFDIAQPTGFSLGEGPRGVIPSPDWKKTVFEDGTWRVGDTYNTVIGQFGMQVTPMQMLRAVAGLANNGTLVTPHIAEKELITTQHIQGIDDSYYQVIHDALRQTVTNGTASALHVPYVQIAAKTGTAQTKGNTRVNAWSMGFFPYENPRYAFIIVMEDGPQTGNVGSSWAIRRALDWMQENRPEYFE